MVDAEVDDGDDEDGSGYDNKMTNYITSTISSREHNNRMTQTPEDQSERILREGISV